MHRIIYDGAFLLYNEISFDKKNYKLYYKVIIKLIRFIFTK